MSVKVYQRLNVYAMKSPLNKKTVVNLRISNVSVRDKIYLEIHVQVYEIHIQ